MFNPIFKITTASLITFLLLSCGKSETVNLSPAIKEIKKKSQLPGQSPGTLQSSPIVFTNGQYYSSFAGGLYFGTEFPYPSDKYSVPMYSPYTGFNSLYGVSGNANLLEFNMNGHKFVAILGTVPGGMNLNFDSTKYWKDVESGNLFPISKYLTTTGGSSTGLIEIKGKFLIDHNAPFGISIFDISAPESTNMIE